MISRILSLIAFCLAMILATPRAAAQELNCTVEIDVSSLSSNQQVFETLREAVNEYMNNTKFTTAQFSPNEKIECRLFLTVKEYTDDVVKGDLQIQSTRPVYNSSYTPTAKTSPWCSPKPPWRATSRPSSTTMPT